MKKNTFLHGFSKNFSFLKKVDPLSGFTLIEIVVALAILSVSIVIVLQLFSGGLRSVKVSDDYLRATILAQNKMKELESMYKFFIADEGVFEEDDRYYWTVSVENYDLQNLHNQFENLKHDPTERVTVDKIVLTVSWNTEHGQRQLELATLKTLAIVNSASKYIMQGIYPAGLRTMRGRQFGQQSIPQGQSGKKYITVNPGGTKMVIEKANICGASNVPYNICGNETGIPQFNICGN